MQVASVLLMTQDNALFRHWEGLSNAWLPARGNQAADLDRWRARGNQLVVLDADLPGLSAWQPADWQAAFSKLKVVVASMHPGDQERSEERREGKEVVRTCRSRWSPIHKKKKKKNNKDK